MNDNEIRDLAILTTRYKKTGKYNAIEKAIEVTREDDYKRYAASHKQIIIMTILLVAALCFGIVIGATRCVS